MGSRRSFFGRMLADAMSLGEQLQGRPQHRLSDLQQASPTILSSLVPAQAPGMSLVVDGRGVFARGPDQALHFLFPIDSLESALFNGMDGTRPLAQIAAAAAAAANLPECHVRDRVCSLFLRLVDLGICVPVNAPEAQA